MLSNPTPDDVAKAWPWARRLALLASAGPPFMGGHLLVGSDYSGAHRGSRYVVYSFVLVDADSSPAWPTKRRAFRSAYLPDGRRLSFKNLNDGHRRRSLLPFLRMADSFCGQLVSIIVHKDLEQMSTGSTTLELLSALHQLEGGWNRLAFEGMVRIAHLFGVLVGSWSRPLINVSWVTDQDEIVANEARHSDLLKVSSWFGGLYSPHRFNELAIVTTASDPGGREFEDVVALPDLVAGALAEAVSHWATDGLVGRRELALNGLSQKTATIVDWMSTADSSLRRVAIIVDRIGPDRFGVIPLEFGVA